MTETTHTLLEDAANLLVAHGVPVPKGKLMAWKEAVPNVPVTPRGGPNESALSLMEKHKLFAIYQVGNSCWYVSGWKDDQKIEGYGDTLEAAVLKCAAFYATEGASK